MFTNANSAAFVEPLETMLAVIISSLCILGAVLVHSVYQAPVKESLVIKYQQMWPAGRLYSRVGCGFLWESPRSGAHWKRGEGPIKERLEREYFQAVFSLHGGHGERRRRKRTSIVRVGKWGWWWFVRAQGRMWKQKRKIWKSKFSARSCKRKFIGNKNKDGKCIWVLTGDLVNGRAGC